MEFFKNQFEREKLANKLFLKKQYFCTEMKEGTSIGAHLKHMKELTDKLAAIGAPIDEEDQVVTLLGSLPQSYSTLVTALEARVDDIKLDFVQQALMHEEQKLKGQSTHSKGQEESALMGRPRKPLKFQNQKCYHCGQPGHFRQDCPKRKQQDNSKAMHRAKAVGEKPLDLDSGSADEGVFAASVGSAGLPQMGRWLVDSGASSHMTSEKEILSNYHEFEKPEKVGLGDGRTVDAVGVGNVYINMQLRDCEPNECMIYKVLHVPKLACNLFSVRAAASRGKSVKFSDNKCWIYNRAGNVCGIGSLVDKLYQLDCEPVTSERATVVSEQGHDMDLWHQRLGHLGRQRLQETISKQLVNGMNVSKTAKLSFCEGCIEGKMHRKPFAPVGKIGSTERLQLVHSDVCGPMSTESVGGKKYFVTFTDDYSCCCSVYFMKHKSEVLEKFKVFETATTSNSGQRIRKLQTNNGGECISKEFEAYMKSKGIFYELS